MPPNGQKRRACYENPLSDLGNRLTKYHAGYYRYHSRIDRYLTRCIEWALRKWTDLDTRDYQNLLKLSGEYMVKELAVKRHEMKSTEGGNVESVKIARTNMEVSRIALGTWAIGGWMWGGSDEKQSIDTVQAALDAGINLIDTAPVYGFGRSEAIVGKAVKDYGSRDKIHIATKAGLEWKDGKVFRNSQPARLAFEIEDSLRRLQTDYIDIYLVHWPDPQVPIEETARLMQALLDQGKVRAIGVSNYDVEQMEAFQTAAVLNLCQAPYNLFERGIEKAVMPDCRRNNVTLMGYGALCRGLLSGKMTTEREFSGDDLRNIDPKFQKPRFSQYLQAVSQIEALARDRYAKDLLPTAVRWNLDQGIDIAIWGARRPEQMKPVAAVLGWSIDPEFKQQVEKIMDETVTDPVGPEFMAPPSAGSQPDVNIGDSAKDALEKML